MVINGHRVLGPVVALKLACASAIRERQSIFVSRADVKRA
jgi:hypothetical protein